MSGPNQRWRFDDAQARAAFARAPLVMERVLHAHLQRAAQGVAAKERELAPKGITSQLTQSIHARQLGPLDWFIGPAVAYAVPVVRGRQPGRFPDMREGSPFEQWVRRAVIGSKAARSKAGKRALRQSLFLIGRSIARHGIRPHDFLTDTFRQTESRVQQALRAGVAEGIKAVFG